MVRKERATAWSNVFGSFATSQGDATLQRNFMKLYAAECPEGFEELFREYDAYVDEPGQQRIDEKLRPYYDGPLHPTKIDKRYNYRQQGTQVLQSALSSAKFTPWIESDYRLRLQCSAIMLRKDAECLLAEKGRNKPAGGKYGLTTSSYISQSLHFMFVEDATAYPDNSLYRTVIRAARVFRMAIEERGFGAVRGLVVEEPKQGDPVQLTAPLWEHYTQAYGVHLQQYPEHRQLLSDTFLEQLPPNSLEPPFEKK